MDVLDAVIKVADVLATAFVAVVGLVLTHNYRRQVKRRPPKAAWTRMRSFGS